MRQEIPLRSWLTIDHRTGLAALLALCVPLCAGPAAAHPGGLDDNGCHYERGTSTGRYHCHKEPHEIAPNPDRNAAAKKSRENICHDQASPNYRQLRYFVAYRDMDACIASGGRPYHR